MNLVGLQYGIARLDNALYAYKLTSYGTAIAGPFEPSVIADFLAMPNMWYAEHLGDFDHSPNPEDYAFLSPEDVRALNLPESWYGFRCPNCDAKWPENLIRTESATVSCELFLTDDGEVGATANNLDDPQNKPDVDWQCTNCGGNFTEALDGRDLDAIYEQARARADRLDREQMEQAEREAASLRGECCEFCGASMPENLVMARNADVVYEFINGAMHPIDISMLDHTDFACAACRQEIAYHNEWDKMLSATEEPTLSS